MTLMDRWDIVLGVGGCLNLITMARNTGDQEMA